MKDHLERIQFTLDYIENNLKTEITVQELSETAGYSYFHYCQLFQSATGMSVKHYLVSRRLKHAIYEMSKGSQKLQVAMTYGFNTYSGFYKAFLKEYHCNPSEYLKSYKPAKPYKIHLMQEEKIMLTQKTIKKLLVHWGMEDRRISNVYYEGSEQISDNDFHIGDEYILKISTFPGGLKRHIDISHALQKSGLTVSVPIPARDGELIIQDEDLYCILCKRLTGTRQNSKTLFENCDTKIAYQFGKFIGKLHLSLEQLDPSLCKENHLYRSIHEWALPRIQKTINLSHSFIAEYDAKFGAIYQELPKQIIHRNMNLSYVYMENGEMIGITDFELSEYSIRLFDVCYAATGILTENFTNKHTDMQKWLLIYQNLLKGYDEVVHLLDIEKEILPYVVLSIQFICIAYFSDKEKYADLKKINEQMLELLLDHKESLVFL